MLNDHMPNPPECPGNCEECGLYDVCELDERIDWTRGPRQ